MEQSCESTGSGTATSRITPASPETGREGYITQSKLSLQVIMSIVMIMMMVMIMDSGKNVTAGEVDGDDVGEDHD